MAGRDPADGEDDLPQDDLEQENGQADQEEDDGQGESDGHGELDEAAEDAAAEGQGPEVSARRQEGQVDNRQPGRAERRIQTIREEARLAREEAAATRRELDAMRAERERAARQPDPRVEAERIAAMTSDERMQYFLQQDRERHQQDIQRLRFEQAEMMDKASFATIKSSNPIAARLETKVEEFLANARRNGQNFNREVILKYLAGEEALSRTAKARTTQAAAGKANIARQRVRPSGGSSDVPAERRGGKTLEERLADVTF